MNNPDSFKKVGKVKEAHGLKGELYILIFSKDISWHKNLKSVQLQSLGQSPKIYQVEKTKAYKEGLLITLEGVIDRNQSESLKGREFSIPADMLVSDSGETIYLNEVLNFEVLLKDQFVGFVKSFGSNGVQDLLVIQHDDHTYEVPFVSDFILNIDFPNKKLFMDFPEGLIHLDKLE